MRAGRRLRAAMKRFALARCGLVGVLLCFGLMLCAARAHAETMRAPSLR